MTKKTFIKLMQELVSLKQDEEALSKAFQKFEPDFNRISFGRYESLVAKAIREAMQDEYDWVEYWLYELDCGKKAKDTTVISKEGKNIPIKTLSNLYDLIESKI